jgi:hypothetical protein
LIPGQRKSAFVWQFQNPDSPTPNKTFAMTSNGIWRSDDQTIAFFQARSSIELNILLEISFPLLNNILLNF